MKYMAQMEKISKMCMLARYGATELQCQHWEVEWEDQMVLEYLVWLKPA